MVWYFSDLEQSLKRKSNHQMYKIIIKKCGNFLICFGKQRCHIKALDRSTIRNLYVGLSVKVPPNPPDS